MLQMDLGLLLSACAGSDVRCSWTWGWPRERPTRPRTPTPGSACGWRWHGTLWKGLWMSTSGERWGGQERREEKAEGATRRGE